MPDVRGWWYRGRGIVFLVTVGVLQAFQVVFDIISNFLGAGLPLFGDLVFGGFVLFLAHRAARPPMAPLQWGLWSMILLLVFGQIYLDWKHSDLGSGWIIFGDIIIGIAVLFLVYSIPKFNRITVREAF